MISGTIKASPMKLCTVIVLLKAHQNTKRNFQKFDLRCHNDAITRTMGKFGPPRNQTNYISFERFPKILFLLKLSDRIKSYGHLSKIMAYFSQFLRDLSLIILISRDRG